MHSIHILVDYLTICDQLIIFLENCAAGQCIPTKPAKYRTQTFAIIDVTALFMERAQ